MPTTTDWEYRFDVAEQPTSTVEGVTARVTTTDPHATSETPAELEVVVSNRRDTPISLEMPASGFVGNVPTDASELYLYSSETDLEHEGGGVWTAANPNSLPFGYVSSLRFERIPAGETYGIRSRIGVSPDSDETAYPTGRAEFDGQELGLLNSPGSVDPSFALGVERRQ